jgi:hypothetical protein
MDVNSILLAGSLSLGEIISNGAQHAANALLQPMNYDIRTNSVMYDGTRISFQYQLWRLRPKSVCIEYSERVNEFAQCTQDAKRFFIEACRVMNEASEHGYPYDQYKSLYCAAASEYKPTVASITAPSATEAAAIDRRRACSLAVLKARETGRESDEAARKAACKYQE